jgi:hypothetical protein
MKTLDAFTGVYIVKNGRIDFVCPRCAFSKAVDVERFLQHGKEARVKIRCKCRNLQTVILDRRSSRRKPAAIQGMYFFTPKDRPINDGEISIKDLSFAGLGFNLLSAPKGAFGAGDVLRVHFKLFKNSSLLIKKEAIVKQVNGLRVNAEFREPLKTEDDFLLRLFFYT